MNDDAQEQEIRRLISGLLDGCISSLDHERLELLLSTNPRARRIYMQMIDQEIELPCLVASMQGEAAGRDETASLRRSLETFDAVRTFWRSWVFGAAAVVTILVSMAMF